MSRFTTLEDIEEYATENDLEIDMDVFRETSIHEQQTEETLQKEHNTQIQFFDINEKKKDNISMRVKLSL